MHVQHCANISENLGQVFGDAVCAVLSGVLGLEGSGMGENFSVAKGRCTGGKYLGGFWMLVARFVW